MVPKRPSMSIILSRFTESSLANDVAHSFPVDDPEAHQVVHRECNDEGQRELLQHLASASSVGIPEGDNRHRYDNGETRAHERNELPTADDLPPREPILGEVLVERFPNDR